MIYEIRNGGSSNRALCCDVTCGKSAINVLSDKLKQHYAAGKVGVIYCEGSLSVADSAIRSLEGAGYDTCRKVFADGSGACIEVASDISALSEDVRFIIVIGDNYLVNATKLDGRRYGVLLLGAADPSLLTNRYYIDGEQLGRCGQPPTFVIADVQSSFHYATDKGTCDVYGRIMALPLAHISHMLRNAAFKNNDGEIYKAIDAIVTEQLSVPYVKNDIGWYEQLLSDSLQIALYLSMLSRDYDMVDVLGHCMSAAMQQELLGGEMMAYSTWYIMSRLSLLKHSVLDGLTLTADIATAVDNVTSKCGGDSTLILREMTLPQRNEIMRIDSVMREYYSDILDYITARLPMIDGALSSYRRIYNDVGAAYASAIDPEMVSSLVMPICMIAREYSLFKHMFIMGYM